MIETIELNVDGLVGPTYNFCGLSDGNIAAQRSKGEVAHPRQAALQGLAKMKFVMELGAPQALLLPQERPEISTLRRLGFQGSDTQVIDAAFREAPELVHVCSSSSSMWAANVATVTPSKDTRDGRVHFTPANLVTMFHRSLEPSLTARQLRLIFPDESKFSHHQPLPSASELADEGAANNIRLSASHGQKGLHLFVFGRYGLTPFRRSRAIPAKTPSWPVRLPSRAPARQTYDASACIARSHQIPEEQVIFAQQHPDIIDAGVFHNDVISTGNENFFLYHEMAFAHTEAVIAELSEKFSRISDTDMYIREVTTEEMPIREAIDSYLFNSQIITTPNGRMVLLAAHECERSDAARAVLESLVQDISCPITEVYYVDVNQSMRNGGGPACLRLRVVLLPEEAARMNSKLVLTPLLYEQLCAWVKLHYLEDLSPTQLADPGLIDSGRRALDELTSLLGIGSLYPFQR